MPPNEQPLPVATLPLAISVSGLLTVSLLTLKWLQGPNVLWILPTDLTSPWVPKDSLPALSCLDTPVSGQLTSFPSDLYSEASCLPVARPTTALLSFPSPSLLYFAFQQSSHFSRAHCFLFPALPEEGPGQGHC